MINKINSIAIVLVIEPIHLVLKYLICGTQECIALKIKLKKLGFFKNLYGITFKGHIQLRMVTAAGRSVCRLFWPWKI